MISEHFLFLLPINIRSAVAADLQRNTIGVARAGRHGDMQAIAILPETQARPAKPTISTRLHRADAGPAT